MSYDETEPQVISEQDVNNYLMARKKDFMEMMEAFWQATMGGPNVVVRPPADVWWFDGTEEQAKDGIRAWANTHGEMCGVQEFATGWSVYFPQSFDPPSGSQADPAWVCIRGKDGKFFAMHPHLFPQIFPQWNHIVTSQINERTKKPNRAADKPSELRWLTEQEFDRLSKLAATFDNEGNSELPAGPRPYPISPRDADALRYDAEIRRDPR
jgi:hypothetical protein